VDGYGIEGAIEWALGTLQAAPVVQIGTPSPVTNDLTASAASAKLQLVIDEAINGAFAYAGDLNGPAPHVGIRAPAGLGKTSKTLKILAAVAAGRTVYYYVPTHKLAEEGVAQASALGIPAMHLKGRGAPGDPAALCQKADIAAEVQRAGLPVWESLCKSRGLYGGQCEHFTTCEYAEQFDGRAEGKVIFLAHEYLTLGVGKLPKADLVIIDESFYRVALRHRTLPLDRITRELPVSDEIDERDRVEHRRRLIPLSQVSLACGCFAPHNAAWPGDMPP
jgi:hypothetical protein